MGQIPGTNWEDMSKKAQDAEVAAPAEEVKTDSDCKGCTGCCGK